MVDLSSTQPHRNRPHPDQHRRQLERFALTGDQACVRTLGWRASPDWWYWLLARHGAGSKEIEMRSRSCSLGAVSYELVEREAGGWDIVSLQVRGKSVLPARRGEFDTDAAAEAAAMDMAREFAELDGLNP